jgi:glycosyltransferase involved in cell wall biosynthesis
MSQGWDGYFTLPVDMRFNRVLVEGLNHLLTLISPRRVVSFGIDDLYPRNLDAWLAQHLEQHRYDAVIVNYVFLSRAFEAFGPSTLKIIDTHDVFGDRHKRQQALGARPSWFFTTPCQEVKGLSRADVVVAIQHREADQFRDMLPPGRTVITVGHCVDLPTLNEKESAEKRLLFVGSRHEGNYQSITKFLSAVYPRLRQQFPDLEFDIVGSIGSRLGVLPGGCHIVGPVDGLEPYYGRAWVVVNPIMWGTGLKIKTVEALAFGKPLVTTPVGAEGLEEGNGTAFLVARSPEEAIRSISLLLNDESLRRGIASAAISFIRDYNEKVLSPLLRWIERS